MLPKNWLAPIGLPTSYGWPNSVMGGRASEHWATPWGEGLPFRLTARFDSGPLQYSRLHVAIQFWEGELLLPSSRQSTYPSGRLTKTVIINSQFASRPNALG